MELFVELDMDNGWPFLKVMRGLVTHDKSRNGKMIKRLVPIFGNMPIWPGGNSVPRSARIGLF